MPAKDNVFDELRRLAKGDTIAQCALLLQLAPPTAAQVELVATSDWYRSGAETYSLPFGLTYMAEGVKRERSFIFKACVASPSARSIEQTLAEWIKRRQLLSRRGVSVPHLFGSGDGVLLEEFVPFELQETLAKHAERTSILRDLVTLARSVDELGFAPIGLFDDLRSRGTDVVMVDFGQDLGAPGVRESQGLLLQEIRTYLQKVGIPSSIIDKLSTEF